MKNESTIGQNIKFVTYVVPLVKEENYSKVKIEMETGNLVSSKSEPLNPLSTIKFHSNPMVSFNNVLPNINTPVKQEVADKPAIVQHSNKLNTNIKPNDIQFNPEIKREEGYDFLSSETPFYFTKKDSKTDIQMSLNNNNNFNEHKEIAMQKIKKKKKEAQITTNNFMGEGDIRTGRWTKEEHKKFIEAICKFGNEWKKVQQYIKSRSSTQARSHAQKFFLRLKKKFNLSNKDSESSIAELAKLPEDMIINYIRECTNTDANINIEEKDRLINVLINFANFNKKSKRRKSKNSMDKDETNSHFHNNENENNYFSEQNIQLKNDFFNNEENLSINNFKIISEEMDEDMEDSVVKAKKIFKITKVPKAVEKGSPKNQPISSVNINIPNLIKINTNNNLNTSTNTNTITNTNTNTNTVSNNNLSVKQNLSVKEQSVVKEETSNYSDKTNTIGVPFNIKIEKPSIKVSPTVTLPEPPKNTVGIIAEPNNKQNYNYINIMTINLCPPNIVNGNSNKQVVTQNQIPISALLGNINANSNDAATQKIRNQFIQHLITNNLVNVKTIPNIPNNNNNNTINRAAPINQLQYNLGSNLQMQCNIPQIQNNLNSSVNSSNTYNNFKKAEFIQNQINVNKGVSGNNQPIINSNNKIVLNNSTNTSSGNNNSGTNNNYLNNVNNLSFLNTSNLTTQAFNSGKYDEIKNYYNNFAKSNNNNSINSTSNSVIRNSSGFLNSMNSTVDMANEKLKLKPKNNIKIHNEKVSQMVVREFLKNQGNPMINKPAVVIPPVNQIKQEPIVNKINNKPLQTPANNSSPYYYDPFPNDVIKRDEEENDFANPFNINFVTNDASDHFKKEEDLFEEDFFNLNK